MRLKQKTCLITGAAQGIGRATALAFAQEGAHVIATDIQYEALVQLSNLSENIDIAVVDTTQPIQIADLAGRYPDVDVLFNCVGYVAVGDILSCEPEHWHRSFQVNVDSMYYMIRAFLPHMLKQSNASIINMSSIASSVKGVINRFAYSASKAAVLGITKSIAADYIKQGLRCNAICPGTVDSPSLQQRIEAQAQLENKTVTEIYHQFIERQPMGRIAQAEEIAALAVYLASDESAFITGTFNYIDGGWSN